MRVNREIRAKVVRLIDQNGKQIGILPLKEALRKAEEVGLDLVEVAPNADPPVCKIMDYGKYKYQKSKKLHEAKKKQKIIQVKEMKLRPTIEDHDYEFKMRNIKDFLEDGCKVKVTVFFRGREVVHPDLGERLLNRLIEDVKDFGVPENKPKLEGRTMTLILSPKQLIKRGE